LVLVSGNTDFYLIVLRIRTEDLPYADKVSIADTKSTVTAGKSQAVISFGSHKESYVIEKIYKLKDYEQMIEIKAKLIAEMNTAK
jgi:hypothetical protein